MKTYPLLFTFADVIAGNDFFAGVGVQGRALLEEDPVTGETWVYGVNPGGMASTSPTRDTAYQEFKTAYQSVLYDLAAESRDFKEFKKGVESFVRDTNRPVLARWEATRTEVREGTITADWLARVESSTYEVCVQVEELIRAEPKANKLETVWAAAA